MKKIFFMAVSAVLLAAGCQKTEIQNEVLPQIGFKTQMGKLTKAPDAENSGQFANLVEQDFKVWGYFVKEDDFNYKPGDNYFGPDPTVLTDGIDVATDLGSDNQPVCNTGDHVYYWPGKNKELDLYAVSLWNQTGENVNNYTKVTIVPSTHVLTVTDFFVNNDADDDLMVAPLIRQDQDDSEYVQPNFKHALTKVLVNFKSSIATGVYVVSAKITGVKNSGTLTVTNTLPEGSTTGAKVANASFAWALNTATTEYTAICKKTATQGVPAAKPGQASSDYNAVAIDDKGFLTYGSWLLIPHENTIGEDNKTVTARGIEGIKLVVDYIVEGIYVSQTFDLAPSNATVTEWGINMQTSYNVLISPDYITFEPKVQDWTDAHNAIDEPRGDNE